MGKIHSKQLIAQMETRWSRDPDASVFAFRVDPKWNFPPTITLGEKSLDVVRADSVFQIRELLHEAETAKKQIVLLTKLQERELGKDVSARLARCRVFPIDPHAGLCFLFGAKEVDASIKDSGLIEALIEYAPPEGYPPIAGGILDIATFWRKVYRHVFEMGDGEPDLVSLLSWAIRQTPDSRYNTVGEEPRRSLKNKLINTLGDDCRSIFHFIDSGCGPDALALAIVCEIIFGTEGENTLRDCIVRMEPYHGRLEIPILTGRSLASVAAKVMNEIGMDDEIIKTQLHRAEYLVKEFRCEKYVHRSSFLHSGYTRRLCHFGEGILAALENISSDSIEYCRSLQIQITSHRDATIGRRPEQVNRAEMAMRLLRWLTFPSPDPVSFTEKAVYYQKELAFVDWARESICRGEGIEELDRAYRELDHRIWQRREEFNRDFAESLTDWASTQSPSDELCVIEDVLSRYIVPIAQMNCPVLLLVMDGMSWPVCHELLVDIHREHWYEVTLNAEGHVPVPVIATIPCTTAYSRTSLLSGRCVYGNQNDENRNFAEHCGLKTTCSAKNPPVFFHKGDISDGSRGNLSDVVRNAVLSSDKKIVGIVLNAVDDRLSDAQQIRDIWTVDRIGPLGALMELARDTGRIVILTSDHGHVWHRPEATRCEGDGFGRWRYDGPILADGEIKISGPRVLDDQGRHSLVLSKNETFYYGGQHNGYHGGATPQEMICPLVILTGDQPESFKKSGKIVPAKIDEPNWWFPDPVKSPVADIKEAATKPRRFLWEESENWIERIFQSPIYINQKGIMKKHAPEDSQVRQCLGILHRHGTMMTPAAFAAETGIPSSRLDGFAAQLKRLLNVDGYDVLTFSRTENKIELNLQRLKRQFDIE